MAETDQPLAKRTRTVSTRLADKNNDAPPALKFHQISQQEARTKEAAALQAKADAAAKKSSAVPTVSTSASAASQHPTPSSSSASGSKRKAPSITAAAGDDDDLQDSTKAIGPAPKRAHIEISPRRPSPPPSRQRSLSPLETNDAEPQAAVLTNKQKSRDLDHFFEPSITPPGGSKAKRVCKICQRKGNCPDSIVSESTTLRRHIEAHHIAVYEKWCKDNSFESKLPKTVKARKDAALSSNREKQSTLDPHLRERPERVVPYTDERFQEAATEWLISTDQPIQAFEHPAFKKMIDVASRATNGVVIPNRKATRKYIINLFKKNLAQLRERLAKDTTGLVSMTCDAWQAGNADAYFAATGHWTEEMAAGVWEEHSALFGFTLMNSSHDGLHLGRALFRIVNRLGFVKKVGWITCDNATNNITMLKAFESILNSLPARVGLDKWSWLESHIRCLAHVINLVTQALISGYSKSPHFDAALPTSHEPDTDAWNRDEVGLIRSIVVKARSSAKRKQRLLDLQTAAGLVALMLLLDMKVRWSSTYAMLKRAVHLKQFISEFVYETAREETDFQKRDKIRALNLTNDEWERVALFLKLLHSADATQQAFSYEGTPSLHSGIPALEALHAAWTKREADERFSPFSDGIKAAIAKIEEYYEKTSTTHAYTLQMLLDPDTKMKHFKKHWPADLQGEILKSAEEIFMKRYLKLYGTKLQPPKNKVRGSKKFAALIAAHSDSESEEESNLPSGTSDPSGVSKPWLREFHLYLNGIDEVPDDMSIIHWWGLHSTRLPTWASLAKDYLAIMGSSVSSERAFSSAGITIGKRRNRLKGDIVEALQFMKAQFHRNIIFREPPTLATEIDEDIFDDDGDPEWVEEDVETWDDIVIDIDS